MFMNEKTRILNALHGMSVEIEHIGSTAIPGMIAKSVIDMLLIIDDLREARNTSGPCANSVMCLLTIHKTLHASFSAKVSLAVIISILLKREAWRLRIIWIFVMRY